MTIIKPSSASDTSASKIAEQRVREWTMALEAQRRLAEKKRPSRLPVEIHPYITISREVGAGGSALAQKIGQLLGWDVLNREILDHMAEKFNLPRYVLGMLDETTSNWIIEMFGKWLDPRLVTQTEYIVHLGQIVLLAAQHASTIFVGRGAQFFLPADHGISVFLVAPLADRIKAIREMKQCSESEARRYIRDTEKGRRDLVKNYFNREIGDPRLYSLVINRAHISIDEAAEIIVGHCRRQFPNV